MLYNSELVSQLPPSLSPSLSPEENLKLVEQVRAGDGGARESMICGNTAWVMSLVANHIKQFPFLAHLRDDLTSAGFIGLVSAVNQLAVEYDSKRGDANGWWDVNGYILTAIVNEIYQTVEAETMIPIPHGTQWRKSAAGNKIKPVTVASIPLESCPCNDVDTSFDMRDLIASCCLNQKDRTFVEMREASYTLKEIAEALEVSTPTVFRLKRELYARVLEKSGLTPKETPK